MHNIRGRISSTVCLGLFLTFAGAAATADAQTSIVSIATDGTTPGNGVSESPALSADGRFVAFASRATNLIPSDTNDSQDVFVRDRLLQTTTRVSVTSAGEERNGNSHHPSISADGRYVSFQSDAPLVADDTNSCISAGPTCADIYVHDRQTGTTTRVSVSSSGAQGNNHSSGGEISANGRYIVFTSLAAFVDNDTNGKSDVFVRDREAGTTIRISQTLSGGESTQHAFGPQLISADGGVVVYASAAAASELPGTPPCEASQFENACPATYLYTRATGQVQLLSALLPANTFDASAVLNSDWPIGLSADGTTVIVSQGIVSGTSRIERAIVYDRPTGRTRVGTPCTIASFGQSCNQITGISPDGRYLTFAGGTSAFKFRLEDRLTGTIEIGGDALTSYDHAVSANSRFVASAGHDTVVATDNVFIHDRDGDGDGMSSTWEATFGLDASNPGDTGGDLDGDGLTNLQEFQAGSHPNGTFVRYLAEGASNAFFSTRVSAMNPNDQDAVVLFHFNGSTGAKSNVYSLLQAKKIVTLDLKPLDNAPENDFATVIESNRPIVIDRTMRWDATGFGAHAETAIAAPSTTWYLAEGATHGAFDLFYLLQNATSTEAHVTVRYLRLAPSTPIVKTYSVPPNGRHTIYVDIEDAGLAAVDVGATITSDQPIIVERAMYASTPTQAFAAGHEGAGVAAPALTWFLAEGATGSFFDEYVLVANPNTAPAQLTVSYLLPDGVRFSKPYTVGAESRLTISVDGEDPRLADTAVSVIVESTNSQPVVVERAMWWPSPLWYEAHLSAGATTTGTRWGIAGAVVNTNTVPPNNEGTETYVLIANTSASAGTATVTVVGLPDNPQFPSGQPPSPLAVTVDIPANSRVNVPMSSLFPSPAIASFGVIVESSGPQIVVERAMYFNAGGVTWSAGTAALATKLQ